MHFSNKRTCSVRDTSTEPLAPKLEQFGDLARILQFPLFLFGHFDQIFILHDWPDLVLNFWQLDASYSYHLAKLLDYFLRSNKSNINQEIVDGHRKVLLNEVVVGEWMKRNQALSGQYPKVVWSINRYSSQLCIITNFTMWRYAVPRLFELLTFAKFHRTYNSLVDDVIDPSIFVVQNTAQAYRA